jgi:putative DNA primase/helicase
LIPFTVTIPEKERDSRLKEKLRKELPGILNWALIGCAEWREQGLGMPDEIRDATEAYRDEMDTLSEFINECCLVDMRCRVSKPDLYTAYEKWCSQGGEEPLSKRIFGMKLMERGFKDGRDMKARFWIGIGLLEGKSHLRAVGDMTQ